MNFDFKYDKNMQTLAATGQKSNIRVRHLSEDCVESNSINGTFVN